MDQRPCSDIYLAAHATAMGIGPVAFLIKPFDDEKFIAAVRDSLGQA
jgi:FixJ family two-component response regulator